MNFQQVSLKNLYYTFISLKIFILDCSFQKYWWDRFIPTRINMELANFNLTHSNLMSFSDCQIKDEDKCFMEPIFANTAKIASNKLKNEEVCVIYKLLNISKSNYFMLIGY